MPREVLRRLPRLLWFTVKPDNTQIEMTQSASAVEDAKKELARSHLVLTPGGLGITNLQLQFGSGLRPLMAISALVLLIACANIDRGSRGIALRALSEGAAL